MASSFCSWTRIVRRVLCALLDPKSTRRARSRRRDAGLEQAGGSARETATRSSGLDDLLQILGGGLVVEASRKRRIGEDRAYFSASSSSVWASEILIADIWVLHAVQKHVHTADAQHVLSKS